MSGSHEYVALTPAGFLDFAKQNIISPDILDRNDISDRSKAHALRKMLECVQTSWMAALLVE
jgi:hypothetical protein